MRVGLIDVDGKNFPNLALMRISSYHKSKGDTVEWWWSDFEHYDVVYMSKVFSSAYSRDVPEPMNADRVIKGGTGYAITIGPDGREVFDRERHSELPPEMEKCFPDYSIYPKIRYAVAMTSRGCPRGCAFCHVGAKEGRCAVKVADVADFWNGQREIKVLDANLTACREKRDLFRQYRETGARIEFNQGLDIRLINGDDIADLNAMKVKNLHFAWDNPKDDLAGKFRDFRAEINIQDHRRLTVYVLTNFGSTKEEDLYRIYTLRELGYEPFVMVYDRPNAPREAKRLQRWCNNKWVFTREPDFLKYDTSIKGARG